MRLLERQAQLRELQAALERAGQGRGTTVLVSGKAGIGKTWLLQAFAGRVAETARVFLGTCEDLLTPRSLGPFRDMAREEGGAIGGVWGEDRDAVIEGLLREMRFAQRPAVVIVEDAHWADDASLDIIRHLARRIGRLPAMLVVSYRDEELSDDHPLRRIIGALAGPEVLRLELGGLSDATVAQLAAGAGLAPGPVVAAVGGNPFYLSEVLAAPGLEVPPSVRHAVRVRVGSLLGSCRSALERLAVVPAEAELWLVEALLPDLTVLEPAERRGMVVASRHGSGSGMSWPGARSSCRFRACGGSSTTGGCWGCWWRPAPSRRGWSTMPSPPPTSRRWPGTRPRRRPRRPRPRAPRGRRLRAAGAGAERAAGPAGAGPRGGAGRPGPVRAQPVRRGGRARGQGGGALGRARLHPAGVG